MIVKDWAQHTRQEELSVAELKLFLQDSMKIRLSIECRSLSTIMYVFTFLASIVGLVEDIKGVMQSLDTVSK